jgi:hypothetical protein
MKNNEENNLFLGNEGVYNKNEDMNYNLNKNDLYTDSDNEEFFKKNNNIKNLINKNENNIIAKTIKQKTRDIEKSKTDMLSQNYNNHDNTIPISKKSQKSEIQNIDKMLRIFKRDNDSYSNKNYLFSNEKISNTESLEDLKNQKEKLTEKLKNIRMKNKELKAYVEPFKQSMTNEDIENEQNMQYIKYLGDKIKSYILVNNKLKQKLMTNQNINIKKKIEYLIGKQIKEYEKLLNDDLNMDENLNEIKYKSNYTNNNVNVKCELSLSGANSEYKINNVTTDDFINFKHKNKVSGTLKVNNKNPNVNKLLNKNNSLVFCGEEKNKNNNSLKPKRNNSKTNFLSSIKYIKNSKITRNNNTSSSITSSHDNNNNKNNVNKKNDYKLLKQNSKISNGINFKVK